MSEAEKNPEAVHTSDSAAAAEPEKNRKPFHGFRLEKVDIPEGVNDFLLDVPPGCLENLCTGITAKAREEQQ